VNKAAKDAQAAKKPRKIESAAPVIFTVGHSTRTIDEFIALLKAHQVSRLVDVRTIPRSRHNPQFNAQSLPDSLKAAKIQYRHLPELGGLRRARPDSPNQGWNSASFRGFADYMQTSEFAAGLDKLLKLAEGHQVAVMCAEAVPWRCHRSLIADALVARRIAVQHITSKTRRQPHEMTPFAKIKRGLVTYPA
jgi:uncharacterized protein (DUF488 family)